MIWIRGNWLGLIMFVASGLVALICGYFLKLGDAKTMTAVGAALVVMDLAFRLIMAREGNRFFGKNTGGYFLFIPVWLLGLLVFGGNLLRVFGVIKE